MINKLVQNKILKRYIMNLKWEVTPTVLSSKIEDEAILMSFEADSYFGLDPVGSRIWELLTIKAATTNELVVLLTEEYEVDEKTCRENIQEFIDDMSTKKLIRLVNVSL
jgi:hypothetical protein